MSNILTKEQKAELETLKKSALHDMLKYEPKIDNTFSGIAVSDGGTTKMIQLLEEAYFDFENLASLLPEPNELNFSKNQAAMFADVDTKATYCFFLENYRPKVAWSLSAKTRAKNKDLNDELDKRALLCMMTLKLVRSLLKRHKR